MAPRSLPAAVKLAPILETARVSEYKKFDDNKTWYRINIIPSTPKTNKRLSFVAPPRPYTIWRRYEHFCDFHAALLSQLKKDPTAANGRKPPQLPKSRFFVTRAVCEERVTRLDAYVRELLTMPERVVRNILIAEFFGLWQKDLVPTNDDDMDEDLEATPFRSQSNTKDEDVPLDEPWLKPVEQKRQSKMLLVEPGSFGAGLKTLLRSSGSPIAGALGSPSPTDIPTPPKTPEPDRKSLHSRNGSGDSASTLDMQAYANAFVAAVLAGKVESSPSEKSADTTIAVVNTVNAESTNVKGAPLDYYGPPPEIPPRTRPRKPSRPTPIEAEITPLPTQVRINNLPAPQIATIQRTNTATEMHRQALTRAATLQSTNRQEGTGIKGVMRDLIVNPSPLPRNLTLTRHHSTPSLDRLPSPTPTTPSPETPLSPPPMSAAAILQPTLPRTITETQTTKPSRKPSILKRARTLGSRKSTAKQLSEPETQDRNQIPPWNRLQGQNPRTSIKNGIIYTAPSQSSAALFQPPPLTRSKTVGPLPPHNANPTSAGMTRRPSLKRTQTTTPHTNKRSSLLFRSHSYTTLSELGQHFIQLKATLSITPSADSTAPKKQQTILLKLSLTTPLPTTLERLSKKFSSAMNSAIAVRSLSYRDEEGCVVSIEDEEDWGVAKDSAQQRQVEGQGGRGGGRLVVSCKV